MCAILLVRELCKAYYLNPDPGEKRSGMELTEKRLSGEQKYSGIIVSVTLDEVELVEAARKALDA